MEKFIFVTNGMARSGKDTFAQFMSEFIPTTKCSTIDVIKKIALGCGWTGEKEEKDRKFLSDLKILIGDYSDLPFKALRHEVEYFLKQGSDRVLLIDIREPQEIERAKREFGAKTILIKNDRVQNITSNMADAGVYNYDYDFVVENNGTLDEFKKTVLKFVKENLQ